MDTIKGYKGFDKDFKCRAGMPEEFQYEQNKEFEMDGKPEACSRGFHFCENPFDVLNYYPLNEGNRYAEVEGIGESSTHNEDTKVAVTKIKIGLEVSLKSLIEGAVKFVFKKTKESTETTATTGNYANAATTGYKANAATTGNYANAVTTGNYANAATTGENANAATTGYKANAATTGYKANAATTGENANAATTGNYANAATTGENANAAVNGSESIAAALGINSQAKGSLGCWIVLSEWEQDKNYEWKIRGVKTAKVDGKKLKEGVFYKLEGGKFIEV